MSKRLPANPNLENLKNQAKTLLKTHQQGLPEANTRIQEFHPEWSHSSVEQIQNADISLSDAQWVIAREYGFDSWAKLKRYVESRNRLYESRKHLEEMLAKTDAIPAIESSWYIKSKVDVNGSIHNLLLCPVCGETFLWQATKGYPYLCPTCFSHEDTRERFIFWAKLEKNSFKDFRTLFADFSMDELFMLYEHAGLSGHIKDPIKEKLIELYTDEILNSHRKKINWPLSGTQFIEVQNKLFNKAHQLGII